VNESGRKVTAADLRPGSKWRWRGHLLEFVERIPQERAAARNFFRCTDFVGLNGPGDSGLVVFTDQKLGREVEWDV
jgi:hypothetical protein